MNFAEIAQNLPWVLSVITIYMTVLAGNKTPWAWVVGLANQMLWLIWIVYTETWGLIPMNLGMWIVYARNHLKWIREAKGKAVVDEIEIETDEPETPQLVENHIYVLDSETFYDWFNEDTRQH